MNRPPARRSTQAVAWLALALAVSGVCWKIRRPDAPDSGGSSVEEVVFKSRHRDTGPINADASPVETLRAMMSRRASKERDQMLIHAVGQWADRAPDDALEWCETLASGEFRDWALCSTLTSMANHNAGKAASLVQIHLPPGLARNHALVAIAQRWAQSSPEDARRWLDSLEATSAKQDALREIAVIEGAAIPDSKE